MQRNIPDEEVVSPMDFGMRFSSEEAAREYLEQLRWGGNPICPKCGSPAKTWLRPRPKHLKLKHPDLPDCRKGFTVKDNSIFSYSHIPLHRWLHAIYCLQTEPKGKSSRQLASR